MFNNKEKNNIYSNCKVKLHFIQVKSMISSNYYDYHNIILGLAD